MSQIDAAIASTEYARACALLDTASEQGKGGPPGPSWPELERAGRGGGGAGASPSAARPRPPAGGGEGAARAANGGEGAATGGKGWRREESALRCAVGDRRFCVCEANTVGNANCRMPSSFSIALLKSVLA